MSLLGIFFNGKKDSGILFAFPESEKDTKNLKSAIQSFQSNDDPYIRTIATIMQKESRRNQYMILRIIQLLSRSS